MANPFTISFGKKPLQYISRLEQSNRILDEFSAPISPTHIYMITGVRGAGKTVMMSALSEQLNADPSWIVVELNAERDLLQLLAAKLYGIKELHSLFTEAEFDFSFLGFGVSVKNAAPIFDIEDALILMLRKIKKTGKRLLICIDEVTNNQYMKVFAASFQIFLRKDLPVYAIMTGLHENIYNLQNEKSLTFLYRAPKMYLEPLNIRAIQLTYAKTFGISDAEALKIAKLTKGYPFAFQVFGYLYWENNQSLLETLPLYDQYLSEYVYEKIWSELSATDKRILIAMALSGKTGVKDIRDELSMDSSKFSVYRERLKRMGVLDASSYGKLEFSLPRFQDFLLQYQ